MDITGADKYGICPLMLDGPVSILVSAGGADIAS
jgi:hypothetical protein